MLSPKGQPITDPEFDKLVKDTGDYRARLLTLTDDVTTLTTEQGETAKQLSGTLDTIDGLLKDRNLLRGRLLTEARDNLRAVNIWLAALVAQVQHGSAEGTEDDPEWEDEGSAEVEDETAEIAREVSGIITIN